MSGLKANYVENWARTRGRACLRFDYRGHGASSGDFEEFGIGDWFEDAKTLPHQPFSLIGCQMLQHMGVIDHLEPVFLERQPRANVMTDHPTILADQIQVAPILVQMGTAANVQLAGESGSGDSFTHGFSRQLSKGGNPGGGGPV